MVYRGMNIGTGKPTPEVLARYPHHLVDILDPAEAYSAGQFVRDAKRSIEQIRSRGKLPLLVGGTMLYFRALRRGLADLPGADTAVRARIDEQGEARGWPSMHAELAGIDPVAAARIRPNDAQRIQRALEVYQLTGRPLSEIQAATTPDPNLKFIALAWSPSDRELLYAGIELRFQHMMAAGLLQEVGALHARGDLHERLPAMRSVGYRQLWEHLNGASPLDSAVQRAIIATRQLARRQLIWLRSESELQWIDSLDSDSFDRIESQVVSICLDRSPY
jgi:tRNA dimethylallyltransferase